MLIEKKKTKNRGERGSTKKKQKRLLELLIVIFGAIIIIIAEDAEEVLNRILRRRRFFHNRTTSVCGNRTDRLRIWPWDGSGIDVVDRNRLPMDTRPRLDNDDDAARQERNDLRDERSTGTVLDGIAETATRRISRTGVDDAKWRNTDRWRNDIADTGIDRTVGGCVPECNVRRFDTNPDDSEFRGSGIQNEDADNRLDRRAICIRIRRALWVIRIWGMVWFPCSSPNILPCNRKRYRRRRNRSNRTVGIRRTKRCMPIDDDDRDNDRNRSFADSNGDRVVCNEPPPNRTIETSKRRAREK